MWAWLRRGFFFHLANFFSPLSSRCSTGTQITASNGGFRSTTRPSSRTLEAMRSGGPKFWLMVVRSSPFPSNTWNWSCKNCETENLQVWRPRWMQTMTSSTFFFFFSTALQIWDQPATIRFHVQNWKLKKTTCAEACSTICHSTKQLFLRYTRCDNQKKKQTFFALSLLACHEHF